MASEALARLKALGVQLVIDDFGTGYSSLGMLRSFPVDVLKIDRGFVMGLEANANDRVIVSGIIDLAHALHLLVVAEGVETQEQLHHLTELGCDYAQGYYIGKPLPAQPGGPPTWIHPKPMA
jgi:EAL domain-containing protein (putative c-di-GMP-specific phosphodiesterase class I)